MRNQRDENATHASHFREIGSKSGFISKEFSISIASSWNFDISHGSFPGNISPRERLSCLCGMPMENSKLRQAVRLALRARLEATDDPEGLLTAAEEELARWAASGADGMDAAPAEILAIMRALIAEERARRRKPLH